MDTNTPHNLAFDRGVHLGLINPSKPGTLKASSVYHIIDHLPKWMNHLRKLKTNPSCSC